MVGLAKGRLGRFGGRAEVRQTDGAPRINAADGAFDRFISTYRIDLLSDDEIGAMLDEARRGRCQTNFSGRLGCGSFGP